MAPWGDDATLGSGLPDRFQFTVASARIKYPYKNNPQQAALVLEGEQNVNGEIEDQHIWLKAGETFEPGDKEGTFWIHTKQTPDVFEGGSERPKKLNKNSGYGKFLNSITTAENGGLDVLANNQSPDRAKYEIWDVLFWEGLVLDIEVKDEGYDFTNAQGEQVKGEKRQEYIVAVLGKGDGVAGASAETSTPAASSNGSVNPADFETHMSYVEAVIKSGGAVSDAVDQETWKTARESV